MVAPRVAAEYLDAAAIGLQQADEDAHGGRLAGAVWPEETTDLPRVHREIDVRQRHVVTEALGDATEVDGRFHVHMMRLRKAPSGGWSR
jgi:hypothetical protein